MVKELPQEALTEKEKEFAALSYLWIFSVIIYFSPKSQSKYVKYHSKQAVLLFVLSILVYFLPWYLFYINIFILFLMVLGIIEAFYGHWYSLPVIGALIEGTFNPKKYVDSIIELFHEMKGFFIKKKSIFSDHAKNKSRYENIDELVLKEKRAQWCESIKNFEIYLKNLLDKKNVKHEDFDYGISVFMKDKKVVVFAGVEENNFVIVYLRSSADLSRSENVGEWQFQKFSAKNMNYNNFEMLVDLILA